MKLEALRIAIFEGRTAIPTEIAAMAYHEAAAVEAGIRDLIAALDSTTWSSGCWCGGRDKRGHTSTCEGRRTAIRAMGGIPPGADLGGVP